MSRISRGGVFNALDYRDGAVFATSQEAVALVADQTAEATRIHPAAPVSVPRAKTAQSEGKGGEEPTQHDARAAQVRAALDGVKLGGIESRYGYRFAKRVGKRLRKLSLDEMPQFVNALKGDVPLRILKTRPELSEESMGAFALPAKSSTNKEKVFSQVVSCFASGLRKRRISGFNCKRVGSMGGQFLAIPVFKEACA